MLLNKSSLVRMGITVPLLLLMAQPLRAQTSGGIPSLTDCRSWSGQSSNCKNGTPSWKKKSTV